MKVREASDKEISVFFGDVDATKVYLALIVEGEAAGIAVTHDLFDSEMLHMKIARVLDVRCSSSQRYELLYKELAAKLQNLGFTQVIRRLEVERLAEIWAMERAGFELMDVGVTFGRKIHGTVAAREFVDLNVRRSTDDEISRIAPAIVNDPWASRYDSDPAYKPEDVRELRIRWLWNSHRHRADIVLIGEMESSPAGYVTCLIDSKSRHGEVELVGTLPQFRGQHVASRILEHAIAWFSTRTQWVSVRTQAANYAAANLYEKSGFTLKRSDMSFRLNLSPNRNEEVNL